MRRRLPACGPRTRTYSDSLPPQTSGRHTSGPSASHVLISGSHCEPVSALRATPLQDLAAVRRTHALKKAVAALALAPVGLIRSLHESSVNEGKRWIIWCVALVCQAFVSCYSHFGTSSAEVISGGGAVGGLLGVSRRGKLFSGGLRTTRDQPPGRGKRHLARPGLPGGNSTNAGGGRGTGRQLVSGERGEAGLRPSSRTNSMAGRGRCVPRRR